ncbi:MAG: hypothetical protein U0487_01710 [Patescibacteria group bacterium]
MKQRFVPLAGMLVACAVVAFGADALGLFHPAISRLSDMAFLDRTVDQRLMISRHR